MKYYVVPKKHQNSDMCWRYALACLLEINPQKVPNFVTEKSIEDTDRTRKWLREKFKKSMVYLPINQFMEVDRRFRNNPLGGPDGYSILILSTTLGDAVEHAVIAKDGKFHYDPNPSSDMNEFKHPIGFCVVHNLDP